MFDRIVDKKIRDAMAAGEFDDLPNRGRRVDLEDYFATPEPLRVGHSILKNAGCRPQEVELLNEIAALEREIAAAPDAEARAALERRHRDATLRLRILLDRARRK
jgi:hypothetical protein